jgi:hypothetical protein
VVVRRCCCCCCSVCFVVQLERRVKSEAKGRWRGELGKSTAPQPARGLAAIFGRPTSQVRAEPSRAPRHSSRLIRIGRGSPGQGIVVDEVELTGRSLAREFRQQRPLRPLPASAALTSTVWARARDRGRQGSEPQAAYSQFAARSPPLHRHGPADPCNRYSVVAHFLSSPFLAASHARHPVGRGQTLSHRSRRARPRSPAALQADACRRRSPPPSPHLHSNTDLRQGLHRSANSFEKGFVSPIDWHVRGLGIKKENRNTHHTQRKTTSHTPHRPCTASRTRASFWAGPAYWWPFCSRLCCWARRDSRLRSDSSLASSSCRFSLISR